MWFPRGLFQLCLCWLACPGEVVSGRNSIVHLVVLSLSLEIRVQGNHSVHVVGIRWQGRAEPEPVRTHFMRTASPHVSSSILVVWLVSWFRGCAVSPEAHPFFAAKVPPGVVVAGVTPHLRKVDN